MAKPNYALTLIGRVSHRIKRSAMSSKTTCPNCGNRDGLQDNGMSPTNIDYTLLCVARVKLGDDAFRGQANPPLRVHEDGKVDCGMQWSPNAGWE